MILLLSLLFIGSFLNSEAAVCSKERELQRASGNTTAPGYYEVRCLDSDETQYEKKQCWPSTGRCWCVDKYGQTISGSHVNPGETVDCETYGWCQARIKTLNALVGDEPMLGKPQPQCDKNGNFQKSQMWGSTGQKWCAVENGNVVPGTKTNPGYPALDCENLPACLNEEAGLAHMQVSGLYPLGLNRPECDPKGLYEKQQCHSSTGYCWCVDPSNGKEIDGTRKGPSEGAVSCDDVTEDEDYDESKATSCQRLRNTQIGFLKSSKSPILGFFVISCEEDGAFSPSQCYPSTGHCWCVDVEGMEQAGTVTPPGQPRVPCREGAPTCTQKKKEIEANNKKFNFIGMFAPQCDAKGAFVSKQCWISTGQCWCVTESGTEIAYTRRGPADKPDELDCTGNVAPKVGNRMDDDAGDDNLTDKDGSAKKSKVVGAGSTTLIVIIVILACMLAFVVVAGFIYIKRNSNSGPAYTEVDANNL